MRKLTSIFLLFCFACSVIGYALFFHLQLMAARSEMKSLLRDQKTNRDLIEISLGKEEAGEVVWEEADEFRYKGEMFDVIAKKINGDRLCIRCIKDEKETEILNELGKNNQRNASGSAVVQLIMTPCVLPLPHGVQPIEIRVKRGFPPRSFSLPNMALTVKTPPPDVC